MSDDVLVVATSPTIEMQDIRLSEGGMSPLSPEIEEKPGSRHLQAQSTVSSKRIISPCSLLLLLVNPFRLHSLHPSRR